MTVTSGDKEDNVKITIDGSQINAGRDVSVTGIQKDTLIESVGDRATVVLGDNNALSQTNDDAFDLLAFLTKWQTDIEAKIDAVTDILDADKADLKDTVAKIKTEAAKAEQADAGRLERLINSIAAMGPDIFEVVVATLASPLQGVGLILKKIGDKAKLERQSKKTRGL